MSWQERFPFVLSQFLANLGLNCSDHLQIHQTLTSLHQTQKRGLFDFLSQKLHQNVNVVKNFYHNTWVKQFSESPTPYKSEIQELVREVVVVRGEEVREAIQVFVARHPEKQFNLRQLQQVFNIAKYRTKAEDASEARTEGSEGFSVSIDQCLLFQTACGMQE
ncbi:Conserved_hypothetical protein [Hexamita inflata]|uniref:Uncharacterized protein n=1 Tax=Hexamita inflata TaxID=28002 RepID=A0AA86TV56_9EUKA|nr:Conserved hypothetical protein [Hexamita inflata]CAI9929874.1 Conserved hypothetical protein [Hexamita inflata]